MILNGDEFSIKVSDVLTLRPIVEAYSGKENFTGICPQVIESLDGLKGQDHDSEITEATLFQLILLYAYIQTIPDRHPTLSFYEDDYDLDMDSNSGQPTSRLASRFNDVLDPCMHHVINVNCPSSKILQLFFLMYKYHIPLNAEILSLVRGVSFLVQVYDILVYFDNTSEGLNEEILLLVLQHPKIMETVVIILLLKLTIQDISFDTLRQLLMHQDIDALIGVTSACAGKNEALLSSEFFAIMLASADPRKAWSAFLDDQHRKIESEDIDPQDVTGRFVTDRLRPDLGDLAFATRRITVGLRRALHARRLRHVPLFCNRGYDMWDNTHTLPERFAYLLSLDGVVPVVSKVTHVSPAHMPAILRAGRVLSKYMTRSEGIGGNQDAEWGDSKIVCFSASGHRYNKESSVLELDVQALLDPATGDLGSSVFFKFYDWQKISFMDKTNYFQISDKVSVNIQMYRKVYIAWNIYMDGREGISVILPLEFYVYHGHDELDAYITFFIFKVIESLPEEDREAIYDDFDLVDPDSLVRNFRALFFEFFNYAEFDFTAPVNLTLSAIKALSFEGKKIDFDEIRDAIADDNLDFFIQLFENLALKRIFQHSYFLIADILSEAEHVGSRKIVTYFKEHFVSTLSLPGVVAEIKAQTEGSVPIPALLTDTKAQEQLTQSAVTPLQLKQFVHRLRCRPAMLENFLNDHKAQVIAFLKVMCGIFSHFSGISAVGFQAALRQYTIGNADFRLLLSNKMHCQILLYLGALGENILGLDEQIRENLEGPLFFGSNTFTGARLQIFFSGICSGDIGSMHESLLGDLFLVIPPMLLFVPNNGANKESSADYDIGRAWESVQFYQVLFDTLKALAREHDYNYKRADEAHVLEEVYNPKKWPEYRARFSAMKSTCSVHENIDGCGKNLADITAERVVNERLFLNEYFAHFCLDPAHLRSVLGNNYGNFRDELFRLIDLLVDFDASDAKPNPQSFALRALGIQLFYRLKQLEYKFETDRQLSAHAVSNVRLQPTGDEASASGRYSPTLFANGDMDEHSPEDDEPDFMNGGWSPFANSKLV